MIAEKKMGSTEMSGKMGKDNIQIFEDQKIRTAWDEEKGNGIFLLLMLLQCLRKVKTQQHIGEN